LNGRGFKREKKKGGTVGQKKESEKKGGPTYKGKSKRTRKTSSGNTGKRNILKKGQRKEEGQGGQFAFVGMWTERRRRLKKGGPGGKGWSR